MKTLRNRAPSTVIGTLCPVCQVGRITSDGAFTCSQECGRRRRYANAPPKHHRAPMSMIGTLCGVCGIGRLKSPGAYTCSRACGLVRRHERRDPVVFEAHIQKLLAGRRRVFLDRMVERFKAEIAPFASVLSPEQVRQLAEAFARVYRLGKANGWQGCARRSKVLSVRLLRRVS